MSTDVAVLRTAAKDDPSIEKIRELAKMILDAPDDALTERRGVDSASEILKRILG